MQQEDRQSILPAVVVVIPLVILFVSIKLLLTSGSLLPGLDGAFY